MSTPSAEGAPDEVDQDEAAETAPLSGGLVSLGSPDAVVCEDGVCAVPPAF
ncbi:hypothetical protein NF556_20690 [Ornithinimicrobium faecis]|uniref:Uncharacterized protein n=1 Tax=Ornithinimicrobium faecis TaxID=2934158 RepID=A0ABY4YT82_9MICO|nr:hypothetical protein [Ornithinimicrobium sp. HY1793]USQ79972.1 hypothetical protein NF556_20690 [Ornithinimicrobium sp. HY1793]